MRRWWIGVTGGLVVAVAVALGVAQLLGSGAQPASAAPAASAKPRGYYVDSNGFLHFLPWRGEAQGETSAYTWSKGKVTCWYAGATPPVGTAGGAVDPSPTVTASSSASGTSGEAAPVLSTVGSVTSSSVLLAWTRALPPSDTTVTGYLVELRPSTVSTWSGDGVITATTDDAVTSFRVAGLKPATLYYARIRARYGSGESGPVSNVLTGKTSTASASSSTS